MTDMFSFADICGGYHDTVVIKGISASVAAGQVLGVFGRNGVGKTTLARLLQGGLAAKSGTVTLNGENIERESAFNRRKRGLGYLSQTDGVFRELTVGENLNLIENPTVPEPYFAQFPRLKERLGQTAGLMSGGERKILGFVRAMLEDTAVVILDEPSEGVQQENIQKMADFIQSAKAQGRAFILIEQNLELLSRVADRLLGMDAGKVVLSGSAGEIEKPDMMAILTV